jgi:8-oxo-dGTP pyrophosphatase MutT (NUDIX family)
MLTGCKSGADTGDGAALGTARLVQQVLGLGGDISHGFGVGSCSCFGKSDRHKTRMDVDTLYPAATILFVRDGTHGLEVLMVERHANIGFAGGALVWPGGKIDPADFDAGWLDAATDLEVHDGDERAARVGALREAYEECGLLLATRDGRPVGSHADSLTDMRQRVDKDASLFQPLVRGHGLTLCTHDLCTFARWIPPPALHKRFDTRFYLARLPEGQTPKQDGTEAVAIIWIRPQDALDQLAAGTRKIIFPTARNLELLALSGSVDQAFADVAARPQGIVQPVIEDGTLKIRTDLGYPVTQERLDSALRG